MTMWLKRGYNQGLAWVAFGTVGIVLFNYLPTLGSLLISFCQWDLLSPPVWVGWQNYQQLLTSPLFWQNVGVTVVFVGLSVGLELTLGFTIAYALYTLGHRWAWIKLLYFVPFVTPMVSMALVWGWIYEPQGGLLNRLAEYAHLPPVAWLYQPQTALLALLGFRLWKQLGYTVLLLAAGLEALPDTVLEAARLDGANQWQQLSRLVLPLTAPLLLVVAITILIQAFQAFDVIYLLTQGGPDHATEVLVYRVFKLAFEQFQVGQASAMAYMLFVIILGFSLVQLWFNRRVKVN
jgi:multiple sugar transport system permease protein